RAGCLRTLVCVLAERPSKGDSSRDVCSPTLISLPKQVLRAVETLLVCGLVFLPEISSAQDVAAPAPESSAESSPPPADNDRLFGGRRWAIGIVGGYYAPTTDIYGLKVDPLGPTIGLTASWTM